MIAPSLKHLTKSLNIVYNKKHRLSRENLQIFILTAKEIFGIIKEAKTMRNVN